MYCNLASNNLENNTPQESSLFPLEKFITDRVISPIFAAHCLPVLDRTTIYALLLVNKKVHSVVLKMLLAQKMGPLNGQMLIALRTLNINVIRSHPNILFLVIQTCKTGSFRISVNPDCSLQPSHHHVGEKSQNNQSLDSLKNRFDAYFTKIPDITNGKMISNLSKTLARNFYHIFSEKSQKKLKTYLSNLPKELHWIHLVYWLAFYQSDYPCHVTECLLKLGWIQEAQNLLSSSKVNGNALQFCLTAISKGQAKQGKFEEAKKTITAIRDPYWKNQALKDIAQEEARQGKIEEAKQTITAIRDSSWKDQALTAIAVEQAKRGKFEEAK